MHGIHDSHKFHGIYRTGIKSIKKTKKNYLHICALPVYYVDFNTVIVWYLFGYDSDRANLPEGVEGVPDILLHHRLIQACKMPLFIIALLLEHYPGWYLAI